MKYILLNNIYIYIYNNYLRCLPVGPRTLLSSSTRLLGYNGHSNCISKWTLVWGGKEKKETYLFDLRRVSVSSNCPLLNCHLHLFPTSSLFAPANMAVQSTPLETHPHLKPLPLSPFSYPFLWPPVAQHCAGDMVVVMAHSLPVDKKSKIFI